jgi:hypothetical protein
MVVLQESDDAFFQTSRLDSSIKRRNASRRVLRRKLREFIEEILDREGIKGDEAKEIMDKTYWRG